MRPSSLLRLIVVGMAVLYVGLLVGFTVAFADDVPTAAWVGFVVVAAVVAVLAIATIFLFERIEDRAGSDPRAIAPAIPDGRHRILVVADVGCTGSDTCPRIIDKVRDRSNTRVLVVAPTIASPLHHLMGDEDRERAAAGHRLDEVVSLLRREGIEVNGMIGSDLPLEAIEDALAIFPADEIVIVAPSSDTAAWSERDLVERARSTYARPVTHVPVARKGS